ncbi:MAG: ribonuclease III [Plectolyngbya sp. WJT66-NPBG17]|jgi:ribonuclease-3|nr:ribonuclease III [Plectolyngbya sp. WJT66-NPBG17]MBW4526591.1 ribonuclease III [Phormidium tanganyikae FI6-MK23]
MTLAYPRRQQELRALAQRLGVSQLDAIDWNLMDLALIHVTFSADRNYEQLEFVGDAVVKLAAAEFLLKAYPDLKVGEFTALRSVLVSDRILAKIADSFGFDRYLLVAPSAKSDPAGRDSRLADSLEAVLAALYLSTHNLSLIHSWLDEQFQPLAEEILADPARQNYKAALQNWTQGHQKTLPEYRTQETGNTHNDPQRFVSEVWIQGRCMGQGTGRSRKAAEQAAAQEAFLVLSRQET